MTPAAVGNRDTTAAVFDDLGQNFCEIRGIHPFGAAAGFDPPPNGAAAPRWVGWILSRHPTPTNDVRPPWWLGWISTPTTTAQTGFDPPSHPSGPAACGKHQQGLLVAIFIEKSACSKLDSSKRTCETQDGSWMVIVAKKAPASSWMAAIGLF